MQERIYFDLSNVYQNLYQLDEQVEIESDDLVVDYLISEGYTGSVEGAEVILNNMSEEWYNIIVEEKKPYKTDLEKLTALKRARAEVQNRLQQSIAKKETLNPTLINRGKQLNQRIKVVGTHISGARALDGPSEPTRITDKRNQAKKAPLTPKERKEFIATRTQKPTGTPTQRAQRRQNIADRKPARSGETPASNELNLPKPGGRTTREQDRRAKMADVLSSSAGGSEQATTYFNRSTGERESLNAIKGNTPINYGGRGKKRVENIYQGPPTPAASTVNPDRPRPRRVR